MLTKLLAILEHICKAFAALGTAILVLVVVLSLVIIFLAKVFGDSLADEVASSLVRSQTKSAGDKQ